jgi:NAD(P)H dehydrogenase (quinone)
MNISLILAHPGPQSFNHAIAQAALAELSRLGHLTFFHDLYVEEFDPLLQLDEIPTKARLSPAIEAHCQEIAQADGIIIVHPNWWGQPPAIMKGWIDRVIRSGTAYRFLEGDNGEGVPEGLLKARVALVFNTSNTPAQREQAVFGDPLESIWRHCIFGLCGVSNVHREMFSMLIMSTPAQRQGWLEKVRNAVRVHFPAR